MRRAILGLLVAAGSCASPAPDPGRPFRPTAIVIHSTSGLGLDAAIDAMEKQGTTVHALIDVDGAIHELTPSDRPARAARGMDDVSLHVSVVGGVGSELLAAPALLEAAAALVGDFAKMYRIPRSNADVTSRRGIFSHEQAKYRFGGLKRNEEKGRMEPGENFMKALLARIGGTFVEERDWAGRSGEGWVCVWEGGNLGVRGELTKGRGLTPAPAKPGPPLELAEERRLRYIDRGRMEEVRGVVLHFTATKTWKDAVDAFERRRLGPSVIVDTDARAWQVVDRLEDKVAAASGTNDHCIQIEIVGENEEALLKNGPQLKKVAAVLKALNAARGIPLNNRDIDSLRGVFSHGQAKKRWGRSAWMWGDDFDPGEKYMKRVLDEAGGTYVEEKDWNGRRSGAWVVVDESWLP
jgi:N-acetylmuramoyl-L-alanine amidase